MISGQLLLPGQAIKPLKHLSKTSTGQFSSDHIQEESGPIQAAFLRLTSDHWFMVIGVKTFQKKAGHCEQDSAYVQLTLSQTECNSYSETITGK